MKALILAILLILSVSLYSQPEVKVVPKQYEWNMIYSDAGDYKQFVGACTTDAIDLSRYRGAVTLWVDSDTSLNNGKASGSDSCMSVSLMLYNSVTGDWGEAHFGTSTALLDTFARSKVNVDGTANDLYMPMPNFGGSQWAWADQVKFIFNIGSTDTLRIKVLAGGQ